MSLKIVRTGIFMLLVRTEWTDVAWGVMYQAMSHHFILALESFASDATRATIHRTEMWPVLRVYIGMGIKEILCLKRCCRATRMRALEAARNCDPIGLRGGTKHCSVTGWWRRSQLLCRSWIASRRARCSHRGHFVWSGHRFRSIRRLRWGRRRRRRRK